MPFTIPASELRFRATRAGGAGGQHVNTSATRVELLWCPRDSHVLTEEQRARILQRLARRLDADGCVRIVADAHRSQLRNRKEAEARLLELVQRALAVRRKRIATRPSAAAREQRLAEKRRRADRKRGRERPGEEE